MLRWTQCGLHKKHTKTRYIKRVFFHLVGFVGHVVHSNASETRNMDALFFILGWAQCGFHKRIIRTRYGEVVFLHPVVSSGHVVHFSASGARNVDALFFMLVWGGADSIKCTLSHITLNMRCCIWWDMQVTHSIFRCVQATKCRHTIFRDRVGPKRVT
jgi:hypothetical protein